MKSPARTHWANCPERGNGLLMLLTAKLIRMMGRRFLSPIIHLVVLYFYVTGRHARRAIAQYQRLLATHSQRDDLFPTLFPIYRQYLTFAETLLDKLDAWQGKITRSDLTLDDPDDLYSQMMRKAGRGQILVCSHVGNLEVCRALAACKPTIPITVLVHSGNAVRFNKVLADAGASQLNLVEVSSLDAGTMLELNRRIEQGEWLAIAGDRVPIKGNRTISVDFLGAPALLPQGPWLLAGLLRTPVNVLFCLREGHGYRIMLRRLIDDLTWTRLTREQVIRDAGRLYALELTRACLRAPLQWFNFYRFWDDHA